MSDLSSSSSSCGTNPRTPVSWRCRVQDLHVESLCPLGDGAARRQPNPTSPRVAPCTSRARWVPNPHPVQRPSRRSRSASLARRVAARISRKARSAVVSSSTPGVLQATTPIAVAEATSMLSYPTAAFATTWSLPLCPDSRTEASMRSVRWQTIPSHSAACSMTARRVRGVSRPDAARSRGRPRRGGSSRPG